MKDKAHILSGRRSRLAASGIAGLLSALCMYFYVSGIERTASGGEVIKVVAFTRDLPAGAGLSEKDLFARGIPEAYLDDSVVRISDVEKVLGQKLTDGAGAGTMLHWNDIRMLGDVSLSTIIKPGRRAFTISLNQHTSVGNLVSPGDRVDVLGTFDRTGSDRKKRVSVTLLQNVTVLATGRRVNRENESRESRFSSVTLDVSLEQAETLAFAMDRGTLCLALRGREDLTVLEDVPEKNFSDIIDANGHSRVQKKTNSRVEELQPR